MSDIKQNYGPNTLGRDGVIGTGPSAPVAPLWGHGSDILTSAHRRKRPLENAGGDDFDWDESFDCANDGFEDDQNLVGESSDDENPFASIGKILDQHEQKQRARHKKENSKLVHRKNGYSSHRSPENIADFESFSPSNSRSSPIENSWNFDNISDGDDVESADDNFKSSGEISGHITESNEKSKSIRVNETFSSTPHSTSARRMTNDMSSQVHSSKRREEYYSVSKTTTPRYTFTSSTGNPNFFKTPSSAKSLPCRSLFTPATSSQKRRHRHTFRPSADMAQSMPTPKKDIRNVDFVPSFLSNKKNGPVHCSKEEISQDWGDGANKLKANLARNKSLSEKSSFNDENYSPQPSHRRSSKKDSTGTGYLTQRLRSLRSNDQRMAMRLRSGQYSTSQSTSISTTCIMSRKRRHGGVDHLNPRNNASSELDVTVSGVSPPSRVSGVSAFGEGKSILLAYLHRYKDTRRGSPRCDGRANVKYPCFAWILLSHDTMREQGISDGGMKQLRFYDAVVIPPRSVGSSSVDCAESHYESIMPTILCAHLCEQYPTGLPPLPSVTFEKHNLQS